MIDVLLSPRRDAVAARSFFGQALWLGPGPVEVVTDRAPVYPRVVEEVAPAARDVTERYANNSIEADTAGSRRGCGRCGASNAWASARTIAAGHAFVQNLSRGHYPLTADVPVHDRVRDASDLALSL